MTRRVLRYQRAALVCALSLLSVGCVDAPAGMAGSEGGLSTLKQNYGYSYLLSTGYLHTCAVNAYGKMLCWGSAQGDPVNPPADLGKVEGLVSGNGHTCALKQDKAVACWGYNYQGQCNVPADVRNVKSVAAGAFETCALMEGGAYKCWGSTDGLKYNDPPTSLANASMITGGSGRMCALMNDTTVRCWGIGQGMFPPAGLTGVVSVAAGTAAACAVKRDGTVVCWGQSNWPIITDMPQNLTGVTSVALGYANACAVRNNGTVVCWGHGFMSGSALQPPSDLRDVAFVSTYSDHACALRRDYTAVCWGDNSSGQLNVPNAFLASGRSVFDECQAPPPSGDSTPSGGEYYVPMRDGDHCYVLTPDGPFTTICPELATAPEDGPEHLPPPGAPPPPGTLPASVDLSQYQSPTKTQFLGTCYAYAAVAAMEAFYKRYYNLTDIDLSEEYFVHNYRTQLWWDYPNNSPYSFAECDSSWTARGGFSTDWDRWSISEQRYVRERPVNPDMNCASVLVRRAYAGAAFDSESPWLTPPRTLPTQEEVDKLEFDRGWIPSVARANAKYRVTSWSAISVARGLTNLDLIREQLALTKEVVVYVFLNWRVNAQGTYEWARFTSPGAHAMVVVGYDDNEGTFTLKNSWGVNANPGRTPLIKVTAEFLQKETYFAAVIDNVTSPSSVPDIRAGYVGYWSLGPQEHVIIRRYNDPDQTVGPTGMMKFGDYYKNGLRYDAFGKYDSSNCLTFGIAPTPARMPKGSDFGTASRACLRPNTSTPELDLTANGKSYYLTDNNRYYLQ